MADQTAAEFMDRVLDGGGARDRAQLADNVGADSTTEEPQPVDADGNPIPTPDGEGEGPFGKDGLDQYGRSAKWYEQFGAEHGAEETVRTPLTADNPTGTP